MITKRLRTIARACAAVANGEHIDKVDVLEYVPEPLRGVAARWLDCGVVTGVHIAERIGHAQGGVLSVMYALRRIAKDLRDV